MVPLARPPDGPPRRELVCSVLTEHAALRDMLSLVLSRRRIVHRTFARLDELVAQAEALARRGAPVRWVVLLGPGLRERDQDEREGERAATVASTPGPAVHPTAVDRLEAALAGVPGRVDLVVFHDGMDGMDGMDGTADAAPPWARLRPRLRSPMPPRLFDVLRVIDDRGE